MDGFNPFEKSLAVFVIPIVFSYKYLFKVFKFITGKDSVLFAWILVAIMDAYSLASDAIRHMPEVIVVFDCLFILWTMYLTKSYQEHNRNASEVEIMHIWRWSWLCVFYVVLGGLM